MGSLSLLTSCSALVQKLQLREYQPKDKSWVTDTCEELLSRVRAKSWLGGKNQRSIVAAGGVNALLKILQISEGDENLVSIIFGILAELVKVDCATEQVFSSEGDVLIERAFANHESEHNIRVDGRKLISHLTRYGSDVALVETRKIKKALEHDVPLGAINMVGSDFKSRAKIIPIGNEMTEGAGGSSELKRLIISMQKYAKSESLVREALDAIILFVTKEGDLTVFFDLHGEKAIVNAMETHPKSRMIQWRGCMAISKLTVDSKQCIRLANSGACEATIAAFQHFSGDDLMQQQCLWTFCSLCKTEYCAEKLETLGLEKILYSFHTASASLSKNNEAVTPCFIPLKLKERYKQAMQGEMMYFDAEKQPNNKLEVSKSTLPTYKLNVRPWYRTIDALFEQGDPGLL